MGPASCSPGASGLRLAATHRRYRPCKPRQFVPHPTEAGRVGTASFNLLPHKRRRLKVPDTWMAGGLPGCDHVPGFATPLKKPKPRSGVAVPVRPTSCTGMHQIANREFDARSVVPRRASRWSVWRLGGEASLSEGQLVAAPSCISDGSDVHEEPRPAESESPRTDGTGRCLAKHCPHANGRRTGKPPATPMREARVYQVVTVRAPLRHPPTYEPSMRCRR